MRKSIAVEALTLLLEQVVADEVEVHELAFTSDALSIRFSPADPPSKDETTETRCPRCGDEALEVSGTLMCRSCGTL